MKFFTNKKMWSKIVIVLIFLILFQFTAAKPAFADDFTDGVVEFGGKLLSPILSLVVTIADSVIGIIHDAIMGVSNPLLVADMGSSIWEIIGKVFVWVLAAVVAGVLIYFTGGLIGPLLVGVAVGLYGCSVVDNIATDNGEML